jgi:class 3 adenylate cyclase
MDELDARRRLAQYLPTLHGDIGYGKPVTWLTNNPVFARLPNGDWAATDPDTPGDGVLLKTDGTTIPFFGALGKMTSHLGWRPASREYFLGSTLYGRYQFFEQGLAVWEDYDNLGNAGHPIIQWPSVTARARTCTALTAFFDLRGFTTWSAGQEPLVVQEAIENFENAFQHAFSRRWCQRIFAKGTGDGLMVVSEAACFAEGPPPPAGDLHPRHCAAFCLAAAQTVVDAASLIPRDLAVGCGVTLGRVMQLYLLGRPDYIGPEVNSASKIQSVAYSELCLSNAVVERLASDGFVVHGTEIPGKAIRIGARDLVSALSGDA